jgi:hypothetical protein
VPRWGVAMKRMPTVFWRSSGLSSINYKN